MNKTAILKALEPVLKNWRALALCAAALLVAGFLFYLWAYDRGKSACEASIAKANLTATEDASKANQTALGKELNAQAGRIKEHGDLKRTIDDAKNSDADDPAPALDQLFYDRLRNPR